MNKLLHTIWILIALSLSLQASVDCIKEGKGKEYKGANVGKYLENTCNVDLYVFWCHDPSPKGDKRSECGAGKMYYYRGKVLEPGDKKFGLYHMPMDATVRWGSCAATPFYKRYKAVQKYNSDGTYECKVSGVKETPKSDEIVVSCPSRNTKFFKIISVSGKRKNLIKLKERGSDILFTINTRTHKNADAANFLCSEPADKNFNLMGKLKYFIRTQYKDSGKEYRTGSSGVRN